MEQCKQSPAPSLKRNSSMPQISVRKKLVTNALLISEQYFRVVNASGRELFLCTEDVHFVSLNHFFMKPLTHCRQIKKQNIATCNKKMSAAKTTYIYKVEVHTFARQVDFFHVKRTKKWLLFHILSQNMTRKSCNIGKVSKRSLKLLLPFQYNICVPLDCNASVCLPHCIAFF